MIVIFPLFSLTQYNVLSDLESLPIQREKYFQEVKRKSNEYWKLFNKVRERNWVLIIDRGRYSFLFLRFIIHFISLFNGIASFIAYNAICNIIYFQEHSAK